MYIFWLMIGLSIFYIDGRGIWKQKQYWDLSVFTVFLCIGTGLLMLISMGIHIKSPFELLISIAGLK